MSAIAPPLAAALAAALLVAGGADLVKARRSRRRHARERERIPAATRAVEVLAALGRALRLPGAPADLQARLTAAGSTKTAGDVMAVKAGAALAALAGGLAWSAALPGRLGLVAPGAFAVLAFLAPDLRLARTITRRRTIMQAELADVLDLLRVALAAGLPVNRALAEVGRRHPGLLAAELKRTANALALGVPRRDALSAFTGRTPLPQAPTVAAVLNRASRHGIDPGQPLAALAAEARAAATRAELERAARAAPQIQLVVALGLVPSALLLVAAALVPSL